MLLADDMELIHEAGKSVNQKLEPGEAFYWVMNLG